MAYMSRETRNYFLLFITAVIWGSGFVAQALGMEHVSPFTFTWARSLLGGCFLLVLIPILDAWASRERKNVEDRTGVQKDAKVDENVGSKAAAKPSDAWKNPTLWLGGFCCGTVLFISESLQQFGLLYTAVGKAGFLTSLYVVIVPLAGILIGRRTSLNVWVAVVLALVGLYFLCMPKGEFSLSIGDALVLACAFSFSVHILMIDRFAPLVDCVRMSCIQFFTGSLWGLVLMLIYEPPTLAQLLAALPAIVYAGIMSNGIAYTLQIVAQNGVHPTIASIILSAESMVSVLMGWLIMNQTLTLRELGGCAFMLAAIIIAQLPASLFRRRRKA